MKKRILSMFLAIVMVVGMLSAVPVYAAEDCDHVDGDDTDHWCDVCYDPMEELCTDADGNHFCDVCTGHAYRFCTAEGAGTWDGGTWDQVNHLVICSVCHWSRWENHTDETDDGYCDVCGAYTGCTHANDSLTMFYAEAGHKSECSACEKVVKQDLHNLTYISDNGGHLPDCRDSDCDYPFDKVSHVHESKNWTGRNYAGHYVECDVCEYEVWQDHTALGTCGICGLNVTFFCEVYVGGQGLLNGQYLDNDGNITYTPPSDGGYAHFAGDVLELNNYVYEGHGSLWLEEPGEYQYYAAVVSFVPLKLELTGTNALTTVVDEINDPEIDGILSYLANGASGIAAARGGLTIGGSGSLEISTPDMGIAADSDLTIESGEITIDTEDEGLDLFNCNLKIKGGTISITAEDGDGIDMRNSSLMMWDGILTMTSKDDAGIDLWDSSLTLWGGTVHITSEDYGICGYEGGSVDISGGHLDIQTDNDTALEAMRLAVAEGMLPEGCKIGEVEYDTFGIVDQEGIPLTCVILAEPQITGVTVIVDGVPYTDGRVVITPETESVVFTVSGTNFSKHSEKHLIVYANGVTISTTDTQFVIDEAAGTATWTVPVDLMDEFIGLFGFEIAYSDDGNVQEALVGTGIFLTYCAEHTPDNRGQTCQGYFCTACESWYGEKNDNHDWSNENGICARGCGTECAHESYTEGVCDVCGYDITAPVISGVENGKTYYTTQKVTVTDKNLDTVTLNGNAVTGTITLDGNKDVTYTIVATDKAGNSTTVTVTMKPIATISEPIDGITDNDVTSDDKDTVQDVIDQVTELLEDDGLTDEEKAALEEIKEKADDLKEAIEDAAKATETENTEKVKDVTAENVTPEDKTDLEKAKDDLEKALDDNGGNYTDAEKKAIEEEIKRIDDALKVVENVEGAEGKINALPENITKDDTDDVDAAKKAYDELSDYEKTLVDPEAKKKLDEAIKAAEEANKPADTNSPQTGDNSHMGLWFALMLGSLAALFAIFFGMKKRKAEDK